MRANAISRKETKAFVPSPVTPAVTGIDYPSNDDLSTEIEDRPQARNIARALYTHPNIAGSTIEDVEPPADARSLDQVWGTIRLEKERKMAKERAKVQSLEEMAQELFVQDHRTMQGPGLESPPISAQRSVRRHKSISNIRESTDGRSLVVTFELPNVDKEDIHISFQRNKLVLTWETAEITGWGEQEGIVLREQVRTKYHRTLPLPDGTRFEEIHAQMTSKGLTLRYPNMRCNRVDVRSSGNS